MPAPGWDDIWHLAATRAANAEEAVRQVYEWRHTRAISAGVSLLGSAFSFLAAVAIAVLREEITASAGTVYVVLTVIGVLGIVGGAILLRARRIHHEFLFYCQLLALLRRWFP